MLKTKSIEWRIPMEFIELNGSIENFDLSVNPNNRISLSVDLFTAVMDLHDSVYDKIKQGDKIKIILKYEPNEENL